MSDAHRPTASASTFAFFNTLDGLLRWLEKLGLTLEDAERTIKRACAISGLGARPEEIRRYFCELHGVTDKDAWRVDELAAFFHFRRRLQRIHGGRFIAETPQATITALVTLPVEEYDMIAPFVHRGSAVFGPNE